MALHIQHEAELPAMQQGVPLRLYCDFYFDGGIVVAGAMDAFGDYLRTRWGRSGALPLGDGA